MKIENLKFVSVQDRTVYRLLHYLTTKINNTYDYTMDPKKQDLNPELKQVYDRVMNTKVAAQGNAPSEQTAPGTPPPPSVAPNPQNPLGAAPGSTSPQTSQENTPQSPPGASPMQGSAQAPVQGTPQNQFLSSAPPRPVAGGTGSFVFTGNKVITPQGGAQAQKTGGGKGLFSSKIILLLVLILIAVWGVLWAKIFALF